MALVAIFTIGRLGHPYEHPASREFYEVGFRVMRQANFLGDFIKEVSPDGVTIPDGTYKGNGSPVLTLTVWKNLQSLYRFTYAGRHKQAIRDRHKWVESYHKKQPTYVVWWTENIKEVSWEEAFKRYNFFIQNGPTSFAFDFKHAYDEVGQPFLIE